MKHIFFDFNGTLLDDLATSLQVLNDMLAARQMPLVSKEEYLSSFGFPVHTYYQQVGFNFEKEGFQALSHEFIGRYEATVSQSSLHKHVEKILASLQEKGYILVVISASEINLLNKLLRLHQIDHYFDTVLGLDNIFAHSKIEVAQQYMQTKHLDPTTTYLIGDTLHDYEVAQQLGCLCILVAQGHQNKQRLLSSKAVVVDTISQIMDYI